MLALRLILPWSYYFSCCCWAEVIGGCCLSLFHKRVACLKARSQNKPRFQPSTPKQTL
ncbi:Uncharacterised protein [Vibrio cholerae]|nr:Uncharacterised protein [Vibrio cholerae]